MLARECYQAVLASKENHAWMVEEEPMKLTRELEDVEPVEGDPLKVTKVGEELNSLIKGKVVKFLKENLDVFA